MLGLIVKAYGSPPTQAISRTFESFMDQPSQRAHRRGGLRARAGPAHLREGAREKAPASLRAISGDLSPQSLPASFTSMKKASEYRQHAAECRALAAKMDSPEQRDQLIEMAGHWERLADDRAKLIERHPELAQIGEREEEARRTTWPH